MNAMLQKTAELAMLAVSADESLDFADMVEFANDLSDVTEPPQQLSPRKPYFCRADEPSPGLTLQQVLQTAGAQDSIAVPSALAQE